MEEANLNKSHSRWSAALLAVVVFVVSLVVAYLSHQSQKDVLQQILQGQADQTQSKMLSETKDVVSQLYAMSNRWVRNSGIDEDMWRSDATNLIQRIEGIESIWWIDKAGDRYWSETLNNSARNMGVWLTEQAGIAENMAHAKSLNMAQISQIYIHDGVEVVYMIQPIGQGDAFDGFLVLAVKVTDFIDHVLGKPMSSGYYTQVQSENGTIFSNGPGVSDGVPSVAFKINFDDDAEIIDFLVYPTQNLMNMIVSGLPYFIAIAGFIIALFMMMMLWSKQRANNQSLALANEISEKEKVQFELEYLANHDALTHLPNRHYITNFIRSKVSKASTKHQAFSLLFIDLDHFKDINDTLGHAVGDEMLKKLPVLFNKVFRHDDVIARMGGDEFVVYLPGQMSIESVTALVERFLESLEVPIEIDDHLIRLTGSVGVAFYPDHGQNVTELLSHADAALYRAKDQGRNTFAIYDKDIEEKAKARVKLISRLHRAHDRDEFEIYFQPRYDLASRELTGAEALLRWKTPQKELISPASFLDLLEETSLIIPISWRLLKRSCEQFSSLLDKHPDLFMSFNISARQLEHPEFLERLQHIIDDTGYPAKNLELELTEQTLIQNVENSQSVLNQVAEMGISIAIDDFGTGYSSLSYLKNFPVNVLKIDKSFIQDIDTDKDDLELVKTMISMGQNLNITTVAEGVETESQLALLNAENCDQVQGYFFKTPMCFYDFYQLLS